jgi:hypothetical protein
MESPHQRKVHSDPSSVVDVKCRYRKVGRHAGLLLPYLSSRRSVALMYSMGCSDSHFW